MKRNYSNTSRGYYRYNIANKQTNKHFSTWLPDGAHSVLCIV